MSLAPCYSRPLTIWMKNAFQRGHARIPSITNVDVDYDNEVLTVNVQNYTETVWIYIYDINVMIALNRYHSYHLNRYHL